MAITTQKTDTFLIEQAILDAVKKDTEYAFEDLKKQLIERLDRERDTIIASTALNVMKLVNVRILKTVDMMKAYAVTHV